MKLSLLFLSLVFIASITFTYSQNDSCAHAIQACEGNQFVYDLTTNVMPESTPGCGCPLTGPSATWFYIRIAEPGNITLNLVSPTGNNLSFAAWGGFSDPVAPCVAELTSSCTSCPSNNGLMNMPNGYPSLNLYDYNNVPSSLQFVHISNALTGMYFLISVINNSNTPGTVFFEEVWPLIAGEGSIGCESFPYTTGKVYLDTNTNSMMDIGEMPLQNIFVKADSCSNPLITCVNGNYYSQFCTLTDTLRAFLPPWAVHYSFNPPKHYVYQDDLALDFPVILDTNLKDLEIVSLNYYPNLVPGFNASMAIRYRNLGGKVVSPVVTVTTDNQLTYNSAVPVPNNISGNIYTWNLPPISPMESGNIYMYFNTPIALPAGTSVSLTAHIDAGVSDVNPANNTVVKNQIVVNAYDPNSKEVFPEGIIDINEIPNAPALDYTIHFQNLGTSPAVNVRIVDTLSSLLQLQTFDFRGSSHSCNFQVEPSGVVTFYLNEINLPDNTTNEAASHGFVSYTIRTKNNLHINDKIFNTAHIFFDFNEAVVTDTTFNIVGFVSENEEIGKPTSLICFSPNPAKDNITVYFPSEDDAAVFSIHSITGKKLMSGMVIDKSPINIRSLLPGIYIINITSNSQTETFRFIKE